MDQATVTPEGVVQIRKVENGLPIEAGASLVFEPGGTHLMLVGLAMRSPPASSFCSRSSSIARGLSMSSYR